MPIPSHTIPYHPIPIYCLHLFAVLERFFRRIGLCPVGYAAVSFWDGCGWSHEFSTGQWRRRPEGDAGWVFWCPFRNTFLDIFGLSSNCAFQPAHLDLGWSLEIIVAVFDPDSTHTSVVHKIKHFQMVEEWKTKGLQRWGQWSWTRHQGRCLGLHHVPSISKSRSDKTYITTTSCDSVGIDPNGLTLCTLKINAEIHQTLFDDRAVSFAWTTTQRKPGCWLRTSRWKWYI